MKILLTGDWQAQTKNLDRCEEALAFAKEYIDKNEIDAVGLLGDLKDPLNPVTQQVTNFLLRMGSTLAGAAHGDYNFIVEGNHDRVGLADGAETCLPLFEVSGFQAVGGPTLIGWHKKHQLWGIPFYRDLAAAEEALKQIPDGAVVFFHNEVVGCSYLNHKSTVGLRQESLRRFALAIGGHIHQGQRLDQTDIWFAGSPFCHDWGEANQEKYMLLLDLSATYPIVSRIKTPFPIWYDPEGAGYRPSSWKGVRVRIRLPLDHKKHEQIRAEAGKQYPGALFHYEQKRTAGPSTMGMEFGNDTDLIHQYLANNQIWPEPAQLEAYLADRMADLGTGLRGLRGAKFLDVEGSEVLCFEKIKMQLDSPGITLVTGKNMDWPGRSNGSGKTSALCLPLVAHFGKTAKKQEHDGWARQGSKRAAWVKEHIQLADGKILEIHRGRRPGKFNATLEGKALGSGDAKKIQREIEDRTGISWDVLTSALYVGQDETSTLLLGTDKERQELFNQFLGFRRFEVAAERISADQKKTRLALADMERLQDLIVQDITGKKTLMDHLEREVAAKQAANQQLKNLKQQLATAERDLVDSATLVSLQEKAQRADAAWRAAYKSAAVEEAKIQQLENTVRSASKAKICPTCRRPLPSSGEIKTDHLKKEIETIRFGIAANAEKLEELHKARTHADSCVQARTVEQNTARSMAAKLRVLISDAEESIAFEDGRSDLQKEIIVLEKHAEAGDCYLTELAEHLRFLAAAGLVVGRKGLPAFLCTLICPQLTEAAAEFSDAFAEAEIHVEFLGSDGDVDISVENHHGGESIRDQSRGELRIAALIASFAMRACLAPYNLLILDEPGEGMDAHNASVFARGLTAVAKRFGSLFITTHNPAILESLDYHHHLEVVKQNRISTLHQIA